MRYLDTNKVEFIDATKAPAFKPEKEFKEAVK